MRETIKNLQKVLTVNAKINSTLNLDELLGIIMNTAADVMRAEAASLMLIDPETDELVFKVALGPKGEDLREKFRLKMGEGIAGSVAQTGKSEIVGDTRKDSRFAGRVDESTGFTSKAIICVPMRVKGQIIGILEALNPIGRDGFSESDLELFEAFADQAAISVEHARLHTELVHQERAKQELKIARQIQSNFLPDLSQQPWKLEIVAQNLQAREVGGDFYDVIPIDEDRIGIVIGDVSGKGVPAALYMVRAVSDYRYLIPQHPSPAELLKALNNALAKDSTLGMFITLNYILVDLREQKIAYASAGHHPPIHRAARSGKISFLDKACDVPLGLMPGTEYSEEVIQASPGDVFCLFTDGITEARNKAGEEFSLEKLRQSLEHDFTGTAQCSEKIFQDIHAFTKGRHQHDDMTLILFTIPRGKAS